MLNIVEVRTILELSFKEYCPFVSYTDENVVMTLDDIRDVLVTVVPSRLEVPEDVEFYTVYFENEEGNWITSRWEIEDVIAYIRKRIRKMD